MRHCCGVILEIKLPHSNLGTLGGSDGHNFIVIIILQIFQEEDWLHSRK